MGWFALPPWSLVSQRPSLRLRLTPGWPMATDTPTLTEATEPMDTGTPMLIMVSTTERGLLRLSPRPRLRLTPGWLMVMLATPMLIMATTTARGLPMLSPRLRLMLMLTTATTATPGPTPMDTDTVLATEATTGDKF